MYSPGIAETLDMRDEGDTVGFLFNKSRVSPRLLVLGEQITVNIYIYIYIYTYTYTHTYVYTYIHTYIHIIYIHNVSCVYVHIYVSYNM